jgi:hypothetical protein
MRNVIIFILNLMYLDWQIIKKVWCISNKIYLYDNIAISIKYGIFYYYKLL